LYHKTELQLSKLRLAESRETAEILEKELQYYKFKVHGVEGWAVRSVFKEMDKEKELSAMG
jgi:hypothetical protein